MKFLLWLWLLREIVIENTVEELETVFCATGIKVSTVPYLNESPCRARHLDLMVRRLPQRTSSFLPT